MDLRQLKYFLAVAEHLHFHKASEFVHLSQPALTLQIRALEEELGVTLLNRDRHRTTLTAAGAILRDEARALLEAADRAAERTRRAARGQVGLVRIGFISTAASRVLPSIISTYREQHPEVELELRNILTAEQLTTIQNRLIDVGLLRLPIPAYDDIEVFPIHREPFVIILPVVHPLAKKRQLHLEQLKDCSFVMYARRHAPGFHDQILGILNRAGLSPRIAQETGEMYTLVSLVSAGLGVAIAPASVENYQIPGIAIRKCPDIDVFSEIALIILKENNHPAARAFVDLSLKQFGIKREKAINVSQGKK